MNLYQKIQRHKIFMADFPSFCTNLSLTLKLKNPNKLQNQKLAFCNYCKMGICLSGERDRTQKQRPKQNQTLKSNIQNVDVIKVKLKHARDRIKNYINIKNSDIQKIKQQIRQKVPDYEETGNKKPLVPLLQARKALQKLVQQAELKLRVINDSIEEVEMSKMNAQMVNVLDDSNKYIKQIHDELEAKDWRNVLQEAQQKYQIEWPDDSEEIQEDPEFKAMWAQIGGDKIVEGKKVSVQLPNQTNKQNQRQMQTA